MALQARRESAIIAMAYLLCAPLMGPTALCVPAQRAVFVYVRIIKNALPRQSDTNYIAPYPCSTLLSSHRSAR